MNYERRRPPDVDGMVSVKVDNLTFRTTPESLKETFEKYGEVGDVYIPRDRYSQDSRGFGFVRFYDQRDADDAIDAMDRAMLDGREIRVQMAKHTRAKASDYNNRRGRPFQRNRPRRRSYSRSRSRSRSNRRRRNSASKSRSRSRSNDRSRKNRSRSPPRSDSKAAIKEKGQGEVRRGEKSPNRSRSNSSTKEENDRGDRLVEEKNHSRSSAE